MPLNYGTYFEKFTGAPYHGVQDPVTGRTNSIPVVDGSRFISPTNGGSAPLPGARWVGSNGTLGYYNPGTPQNLMPTSNSQGLFLSPMAGRTGSTTSTYGYGGSGGFGGFGGGGGMAPYQYPVLSPTPINNQTPIRPVSANGITQTPRSINQGYAINDAWNQQRSDNANANGTLADFTKNYLASKPTATGYNDQESAAIGKFYGTGPGSVTGDLATIRRQNAQNIYNASQGAIRRAALDNSGRRMMSGNNSSNDHTYAQTLAEIAANTAQQQGAQAGNDYRYVADSQRGMAGQRQQLLDNLLQRNFTPVEMANRYQQMNLGNIGTLSNLENSNSLYDQSGYNRQRLLNELVP